MLGAIGSDEARKRLVSKNQRKKLNLKKNIGIELVVNEFNIYPLDHIIKGEPDALHAMNLYRLLTKNWTEYPNAYKICSKIPKRKIKRLQEILNDNRYSS